MVVCEDYERLLKDALFVIILSYVYSRKLCYHQWDVTGSLQLTNAAKKKYMDDNHKFGTMFKMQALITLHCSITCGESVLDADPLLRVVLRSLQKGQHPGRLKRNYPCTW